MNIAVKRAVAFLLLIPFVFAFTFFAISEQGDYIFTSVREARFIGSSNTDHSLHNTMPIAEVQDALTNHQVLNFNSEGIRIYNWRCNNTLNLTNILHSPINSEYGLLYSPGISKAIASDKKRLSLISLSLGGNSPPAFHA